jgi:hypothetical protein
MRPTQITRKLVRQFGSKELVDGLPMQSLADQTLPL